MTVCAGLCSKKVFHGKSLFEVELFVILVAAVVVIFVVVLVVVIFVVLLLLLIVVRVRVVLRFMQIL